jgi:hypothetical protein
MNDIAEPIATASAIDSDALASPHVPFSANPTNVARSVAQLKSMFVTVGITKAGCVF